MDSSFEESESHDGVDSNQGERPTLDAEQEASSAPTSSFELTDRQVVKQMIENHPCFPVRYTHEGIWLRWDGMRWQQTNADDVKRVLLRCNEEYMEGLDEGDVERLELCHKLDDTGSRLLALAKTVDDLVLDDRLLDKRPELLNCVNGTVDLRTGELYPHDRGHHLTQVAPMEYQPDAECPEFAAFLERTFDGDHELIDHVLTVLGYSLTGDTGEQIFWVWYGPTGQNGKSVLANILRKLLEADYYREADSKTLCGGEGQVPNDVARLKGCRFVSCREPKRNARINESLVKSLVGQDAPPARFLRQEYFELEPKFKLHMLTNYLPAAGNSDAIWRRIRVLPFNVRIPDSERRTNLAQYLVQKEGPGILALLVKGAVKYFNEGLKEPKAVLEATEAYRQSQLETFPQSNVDSTAGSDFITACLTREDGAAEAKATLYEAYKEYCHDRSLWPVGEKKFGSTMIRAGFEHPSQANYRVKLADGKEARAWCVFRRFRPLVPKEGARLLRRKAPGDSEGFGPTVPIESDLLLRTNRSVATRVFQLLSVL